MKAIPIDTRAPDGDAKRERMLRQIAQHAVSKLGIFRRVDFGRGPAPRLAIKAQCLHCAWMDIAAIQRCTDTACPLWRVRPYQDSERTALCLTLPPAG